MKKHPCDGGCWFCHDDEGEMLFSVEFDCYVHEVCIRRELCVNPEHVNPEACIMAKELLS